MAMGDRPFDAYDAMVSRHRLFNHSERSRPFNLDKGVIVPIPFDSEPNECVSHLDDELMRPVRIRKLPQNNSK